MGTPLASGFVLTPISEQNPLLPEGDASKYRTMVGSLLYLATATRLDIAYAVAQLARRMTKPTSADMVGAKHVLRYLKGTVTMGLTYDRNIALSAYADASYASDVDTRRSVGAYVCMYNGAAVAWRSKLQPVVALSTTEAEYIALADGVQQVIYLQNLALFVGVDVQSTVVFEDNQPCLHLATNASATARSKHIDVKYHYVREWVLSGRVTLRYVPSAQMIADGLTKALGKEQFVPMRAIWMGTLH